MLSWKNFLKMGFVAHELAFFHSGDNTFFQAAYSQNVEEGEQNAFS